MKHKKISFYILTLIIAFGSGAILDQTLFHCTPSYEDQSDGVGSIVNIATTTEIGR